MGRWGSRSQFKMTKGRFFLIRSPLALPWPSFLAEEGKGRCPPISAGGDFAWTVEATEMSCLCDLVQLNFIPTPAAWIVRRTTRAIQRPLVKGILRERQQV